MSRIRHRRDAYRHFARFATRWRDNDVYAHMNNAVYYEYVDTLVNGWLISTGALAVPHGPVICLVAETGCVFHAALGFPEPVDAGLRVERLGQSSITYGIGLFAPDAEEEAATARYVHVCVDRETRRPVAIPAALREALSRLA